MFGGSIMGTFDNDPFFQSHREHMQGMNAMFQNPFGHSTMGGMPSMMAMPSMLAVSDGREHDRDRQRRGERQRPNEVATRDPLGTGMMFGDMFGNMNRMMSNMRGMMNNMHTQMAQPQRQPGTAGLAAGNNFYSQSTVMTYSNDGTNKPKVYQATTSTRQAGGVKEVRKSVRDSEKGTEKIAVGHHIGDRAHVITKERDRRTGDINEEQELVNLDEEEVGQFDSEWKQKTRTHPSHHQQRNIHLEGRGQGGQHSGHRSSHDSRAPRSLDYIALPMEGKPPKRTGDRGELGFSKKHGKDSKKRK